MRIEFGKTEKVPGVSIDLIGSDEKFKAFGGFLKDARIAVGKIQAQIASELSKLQCEVSPGTVGKWETGESFPTKDKLPAIAKVLNLNEQELIKDYEVLEVIRQKIYDARKNSKSYRRKNEPDFPSSRGWRV
jgi:transcriptional regulator with XRE-family HTH domain